MHFRRVPATLTAGLILAVLLLAGCGDQGGASPPAPTSDAQRGFLTAMVPHHTSAVDMAKVAQSEGQSDFVKGLADEIVLSQTGEIGQMRRIHERLFNAPLEPDMGGHMALGLSAEEAGMGHMDGANMIRGKQPFDRVFVDEMVPHHQGAIRMAEAVQGKTRDPALRKLAKDIVTAQRREIKEMNEFREREFGGPVPSSPAADATPGGGHSG